MAQIILDSSNNLIQGDFDNATVNNRTKFKTTTTNATTNVYAVPNGSATSAGFTVTNAADPTNASKLTIATNGSTDTQIISGVNGSGTYLPLSFYTNNAQSMIIDTAGYVGIGTSSPVTKLQVNAASTEVASSLSIGGTRYCAMYSDGSTINVINSYQSLPLVFSVASGTAYSERMRIDSSGNLMVGKTADNSANQGWIVYPSGTAQYAYNSAGTVDAYQFYRSNTKVGRIETTASATAYVTSSDYRLKDDILPMVNALDKVAQLKPVTYKWKVDGSNGQGFIAHELQEVIPDAVSGIKDAVNEDGSIDPQGIDTSFLVATLTAAIKEQQTIINELKTRIEALENK